MRAGKLLSVVLALGLSGCGTIFNFGAGTCPIRDHPIVYGGVDIDVEYLALQEFPLGLIPALVDLPLSLVGDTITLPWSIADMVEYANRDPARKQTSKAPSQKAATDSSGRDR